ncbi:MAG: DNA circularization N-terminal domain-containing protein [Oligoflexales bacterium]|nr:DNA circularization N-terminal domain-containing protein [Oligoflexales bacterium]
MSFKDLLQRASFRGIKFHVESVERKVGFNYKMHVFPGTKRKAYAEELSEEPEILPVEAFLIGPDASYTKDLLIAACRKRTPGKLLHPQIGYINAKCKSFRIRETLNKVGKIQFSMEFVEVEVEDKSLIPGLDVLDVLKKVDEALNTAALQLTEALSILDMPAYAMAKAAKILNKVSNMVTSENGLGRIASTGKDVRDAVDALKEEGGRLLNSPKELSDNIVSALDYMFGFEAPYENPFRNEVSQPKPEMPLAAQTELKASNAVANFVQSVFVILMIKQFAKRMDDQEYSYLIYQLAINNAATDAIPNADPKLADELRILQSMVSQLAAGKTKEQKPTQRPGVPSLVLAYDLFEDISRSDEVASYG